MKDVFLIYDNCCFYEIVTLSYFLRYSGCDLVFCAQEDRPVKVMEGFTVQPDLTLGAIETAKALDLFASEEDLRETVAFWKDRQRMQ